MITAMRSGIDSIIDRKNHYAPRLHFELQRLEALSAAQGQRSPEDFEKVLNELQRESESWPARIPVKSMPLSNLTAEQDLVTRLNECESQFKQLKLK